MRKFTRGPEPAFLATRWEEWGREWETRHAAGKGFHWHMLDGEQVNQKLLPPLKAQTQNHCSFCDAHPVSPPSPETIEHFRPKSRFPLEAFHWPNLYFCCGFCQQKDDGGATYDLLALRPDDPDYRFDRYFRWDFTEGKLLANDRATPEDQARAVATIRVYRLNDRHPCLRKQQAARFRRLTGEVLDDWPYRDFLERG